MASRPIYNRGEDQYYLLSDEGDRTPITEEQAKSSSLDSFITSAGTSAGEIGTGLLQAYGQTGLPYSQAAGGIADLVQPDLERRGDIASQLDPGSALLGGAVPDVAVGTALAATGVGLPALALAEGILGGSRYGSPSERAGNAAINAVAVAAGGYGPMLLAKTAGGMSRQVQRAITGKAAQTRQLTARQLAAQPASQRLAARQQAIETGQPAGGQQTGFGRSSAGAAETGITPMQMLADQEGYLLTPAQRGGGQGAQILEQAQSSSPWLRSPLDANKEVNELAVSNQVRKVFGLRDENRLFDAADLDSIDSQVSDMYSDAIKPGTMLDEPNFNLPPGTSVGAEETVEKLLKRYEAKYGKQGLDSQDYKTLRNSLSKDIRDFAGKGDMNAAEALESVRATLDDIAVRSDILDSAVKRSADNKYGLYLALRKTKAGDKAGGGINSRSLLSRLRNQSKGKTQEGGAAEPDLERLNNLLKLDTHYQGRLPDSGTATRLAGQVAGGLVGPGGLTAATGITGLGMLN